METKTVGLIILSLLFGVGGTVSYNSISDSNVDLNMSILQQQADAHKLIEKDFNKKIDALLEEHMRDYQETIRKDFPSLQDKMVNYQIQNKTTVFEIYADAIYSTGQKPYYQINVILIGNITGDQLQIEYELK